MEIQIYRIEKIEGRRKGEMREQTVTGK